MATETLSLEVVAEPVFTMEQVRNHVPKDHGD